MCFYLGFFIAPLKFNGQLLIGSSKCFLLGGMNRFFLNCCNLARILNKNIKRHLQAVLHSATRADKVGVARTRPPTRKQPDLRQCSKEGQICPPVAVFFRLSEIDCQIKTNESST